MNLLNNLKESMGCNTIRDDHNGGVVYQHVHMDKATFDKMLAEVEEEYSALQVENAKLRDWCGEMLDSLMPEICAKAYWCEEKDWRTCNDDSCGNYSFVIISRELGIEVDDG